MLHLILLTETINKQMKHRDFVGMVKPDIPTELKELGLVSL